MGLDIPNGTPGRIPFFRKMYEAAAYAMYIKQRSTTTSVEMKKKKKYFIYLSCKVLAKLAFYQRRKRARGVHIVQHSQHIFITLWHPITELRLK